MNRLPALLDCPSYHKLKKKAEGNKGPKGPNDVLKFAHPMAKLCAYMTGDRNNTHHVVACEVFGQATGKTKNIVKQFVQKPRGLDNGLLKSQDSKTFLKQVDHYLKITGEKLDKRKAPTVLSEAPAKKKKKQLVDEDGWCHS